MSPDQDPFDEWLREQVSDAPHPYNEAKWLQAQAMLEAAESSRRRKGIFWWLVFGFAFLAGDVILSDFQPALIGGQGYSSSFTEVPKTGTRRVDSGVQLSPKGQAGKTTFQKQRAPVLREDNPAEKPALPAQTRVRPFSKNKTSAHTPDNGSAYAASQVYDPATDTDQKHDAEPSRPATVYSPTQSADAPLSPRRKVLGAILMLREAQQPLKYSFNRQPWPAPAVNLRAGRWQTGIGLAWTAYPETQVAGENTVSFSARIPSPHAFVRWEPQSRWSFQAGLQYEIEPIRNQVLTFSNRTYSFGFQTDSARLTPDALHLVRIPVRIERNLLPHHGIFVGGSLNYLAGVRGRWEKIQAGSFELQSTPGTTQWVKSPYQRLEVVAQAGYIYSLPNGMRLGLTANYGLQNRLSPGLWPANTPAAHYRSLALWWEMNLNRNKR